MDFYNELVNSPLNMLLLVILLGLLWISFAPAKPRPPPINLDRMMLAPLTEKKEYTLEELQEFDGQKNPRILMGVAGKVYDVSRGRNFYGPGGPYQNFAGKDASRGLAKGSFDPSMIRTDKIDPLDDLTPDERNTLEEWVGSYEAKYDMVGWLVEEKGKVNRKTD